MFFLLNPSLSGTEPFWGIMIWNKCHSNRINFSNVYKHFSRVYKQCTPKLTPTPTPTPRSILLHNLVRILLFLMSIFLLWWYSNLDQPIALRKSKWNYTSYLLYNFMSYAHLLHLFILLSPLLILTPLSISNSSWRSAMQDEITALE